MHILLPMLKRLPRLAWEGDLGSASKGGCEPSGALGPPGLAADLPGLHPSERAGRDGPQEHPSLAILPRPSPLAAPSAS